MVIVPLAGPDAIVLAAAFDPLPAELLPLPQPVSIKATATKTAAADFALIRNIDVLHPSSGMLVAVTRKAVNAGHHRTVT
jgi:hypothetical protein